MEEKTAKPRSGGGGGLDNDDAAVVLIVLGLIVAGGVGVTAWPRIREWASSNTPDVGGQSRALLPTLAAAVLTVSAAWLLFRLIRWGLRRRARLREQHREEIAVGLRGVLGSAWPTEHLVVRKWKRYVPALIQVQLTPTAPLNDLGWKRELERAMEQRAQGHYAVTWPEAAPSRPSFWGRSRPKMVLFRRAKDGDSSANIARDTTSIEAFLTPILPAQSSITVQQRDEDTAAPTVVRVAYGETTRDMSPAWRARVAGQISQRLGGQWQGEWDTVRRQVLLHVVPSLPHPVPWRFPELRQGGFPLAGYGVDEHGRLVGWEVGDRQPHGAVVGPTGTGKTEVLKAMFASALASGDVMGVVIDRKFKAFSLFLGYPGVAAVASSIEDCAALIEALVKEMHRRLAAGGLATLSSAHPDMGITGPGDDRGLLDLVPLVVVIDELTQLVDDLNSWWGMMPAAVREEKYGTKSTKCPHVGMLAQIAQLAREARLNLLLGMQRPDAKNFGDTTQMRDNLPHRVSMGSMTPIGSDQQWGDRQTGQIMVENIGEGVSNAGVVSEAGTLTGVSVPRRFKAFYLSDEQLRGEVREHVRTVAPDVSKLDLGEVSAAATNLDAAVTALRRRAGLHLVPDPSSEETPEELLEGGGDIPPSEPAAEPVNPPTPVPESGAEAPAGPVEAETDGGEWVSVRPADLAEGEVVDSDEGPATLTAAPEWVEDDGDELVRIEVELLSGGAVWDFDPEDTLLVRRG